MAKWLTITAEDVLVGDHIEHPKDQKSYRVTGVETPDSHPEMLWIEVAQGRPILVEDRHGPLEVFR